MRTEEEGVKQLVGEITRMVQLLRERVTEIAAEPGLRTDRLACLSFGLQGLVGFLCLEDPDTTDRMVAAIDGVKGGTQ